MSEILAVVALTAATFFSTNLDNLFLLVGLYAEGGFRARDIWLGYMLAALGVVAVAYGASQAVELAPTHYMGMLGLVPLGLGLLRAGQLIRGRRRGPPAGLEPPTSGRPRIADRPRSDGGGILAVRC